MKLIYKIILSLFILTSIFISCKKEPSPPGNLLIFTKSIDSITYNYAYSGGTVSSDGGINIIKKGLCWSFNVAPTINDYTTNNGKGAGSFSSFMSGLFANRIYYVRTYATTSDGNTFYGNQLNFNTPPAILSSVTTQSVNTITANSAIVNSNISSDGGEAVYQRGICWSTNNNPTLSNSSIDNGAGIGSFTSSMNGLLPNTTYWVRAYSINIIGTSYGNILAFNTLAALPTVTTSLVSSITSSTAYGQGNISSDGGATVSQRGVCWSVYPNLPTISPTTNGGFSTDGSIGIGSFSSFMTALLAGTIYNVRAFATNSVGTSYGNVLNFTTSSITPPLITTNSISSITTTSAYSGGNISSDGGATITQRGVCWNTLSNPSIANNRTIDGTGTGSFISYLSGLSPNTYYYVRAYATNSAGTTYGNTYTINTLSSLPSIITTNVSSIAQNSALSGGTISSDGGSSVTKRGICWSINTNPTIANSSTSVGSGTGTFSSTMTGLSANTIYSVRAYATNAVGTAYGNQYNFQTTVAATIPTVTTNIISSITQTTAVSGGNVTSNGGSAIISEGVCWSSTTTTPTIANSITSDGTTNGTFSSSVTGLLPSVQYYLRAYATNSVGTAYGNLNTFITSAALTAPQLFNPLSGTIISCCSTNLSWFSVSGATYYEVNISNINTFSGSNYNISSCTGTLYPLINYTNTYTSVTSPACIKIGGTQNNIKWYWKVRARTSSYTGPWSSTYYYIY